MRVYLAARYSRHQEMLQHAKDLEGLGHEVTSRWIMGSHQLILNGEPLGPEREALFESAVESMMLQRAEFAAQDWNDLMVADMVVSFTEEPRKSSTSRGGRHVEFGAALAAEKRCIVVGWRENVFHCLPEVEFFPTWNDALLALSGVCSNDKS